MHTRPRTLHVERSRRSETRISCDRFTSAGSDASTLLIAHRVCGKRKRRTALNQYRLLRRTVLQFSGASIDEGFEGCDIVGLRFLKPPRDRSYGRSLKPLSDRGAANASSAASVPGNSNCAPRSDLHCCNRRRGGKCAPLFRRASHAPRHPTANFRGLPPLDDHTPRTRQRHPGAVDGCRPARQFRTSGRTHGDGRHRRSAVAGLPET